MPSSAVGWALSHQLKIKTMPPRTCPQVNLMGAAPQVWVSLSQCVRLTTEGSHDRDEVSSSSEAILSCFPQISSLTTQGGISTSLIREKNILEVPLSLSGCWLGTHQSRVVQYLWNCQLKAHFCSFFFPLQNYFAYQKDPNLAVLSWFKWFASH